MAMTRVQLILSKLAEECNEAGQRALKAQQFGLHEIQEGQSLDNVDRLRSELCDLVAVIQMLEHEKGINLSRHSKRSLDAKKAKVEKYIILSQQMGMVEES